MDIMFWPLILIAVFTAGVLAGPTIRIFAKQLDAEAKAAFDKERDAILADHLTLAKELAAVKTDTGVIITDLKADRDAAEAKVKAFELLFHPTTQAAIATTAAPVAGDGGLAPVIA